MDKTEKSNGRDILLAMRKQLDEKIRKLEKERDALDMRIAECEGEEGAGPSAPLMNRSKKELSGMGYQIKIEWTDSSRPVWRRVVVPAWLTFEHLHRTICHVMDWDMLNLYLFHCDDPAATFAPAKLMKLVSDHALPAMEYNLACCMDQAGQINYTYNFHEHKNHLITVEKRLEHFKGKLPRVLELKGYVDEEDDDELWGIEDSGEDYSALLEGDEEYTVEELNGDMDIVFDDAYWNSAY